MALRFSASCLGSCRLHCPCENITMSKGPQAETFVFLDLEATGLPSVDPKIAEISLFAVHRSSLENPKRDESDAPVLPQVPDELTLCMSPERPFTAKATEITGVSSESLARCQKAGFDSAVVRTPQAFLSCPCASWRTTASIMTSPCCARSCLGIRCRRRGAWTMPTAMAPGPRAARVTAWAASSAATSRRSRGPRAHPAHGFCTAPPSCSRRLLSICL